MSFYENPPGGEKRNPATYTEAVQNVSSWREGFGRRLAIQRTRMGLSIKALAYAVDTNFERIEDLMDPDGSAIASVDEVLTFSYLFNVSPNYLLGFDE